MTTATASAETPIAYSAIEHYEIEKALARRLREGTRAERQHLYSSVYDELFRRVPGHPQLVRKAHRDDAPGYGWLLEWKFLEPFVSQRTVFMEIGPGDCALSFRVCPLAGKVYGVDVSAEITKHGAAPENFELIISDGCSIPVPPGSVDVVYSNQLMEHLHPDDAAEQLRNIYTALRPGGIYACVTPNRLNGPHDISRGFDATATGLHLKEYTNGELDGLFRAAGFRAVVPFAGSKGRYLSLPMPLVRGCERALGRLPQRVGTVMAGSFPTAKVLGIRIIARK